MQSRSEERRSLGWVDIGCLVLFQTSDKIDVGLRGNFFKGMYMTESLLPLGQNHFWGHVWAVYKVGKFG